MPVTYPTNISFAYDNIIFDATTITAGSEVATMPASNLRLQERGAFWRATGHDSEALTITLPSAKAFNLLGLVDHNLTPGSTVRVQANSSNSFSGTTPYDETFTIGSDLAAANGYEAPVGKVSPPEIFFLDQAQRVVGEGAATFSIDDAYSAADHADFKPTSAFTVGAWIKKNGPSTGFIFQSFSSFSGVHAYMGWYFDIHPLTGIAIFYSHQSVDIAEAIRGATNICDNNWHLVVATWDGTHLNLFVDGKSDATAVAWANAPAYYSTNYVRIGCSNSADVNDKFFTGSLGDVFIYNGTALTEAQISDIYNNGITITTNLKAWYKFASAALTADSSGNSHTLTAISAPVSDPVGRPAEGFKVYKYAKLSFVDTANTDGYVQLGVLWLGEYLESERNYQYGATEEIVDPSTVALSMGGQDWLDEEEMFMQLRFSIGALSDTAKYFDFRQFFFAVRKTRFFILLLVPSTALGRAMSTAYGRFTENSRFSQAFVDINNIGSLEFKEVR